jgi:hypothetical protein
MDGAQKLGNGSGNSVIQVTIWQTYVPSSLVMPDYGQLVSS